jgi:preprotein translocase subunit Sss1
MRIFLFLVLFVSSLFSYQEIFIYSVKDNQGKIDLPNLAIGQSGVVVHYFENSTSSIIANAKVVSTNSVYSVIEFSDFDLFHQPSVVKSKIKPKTGDRFVVNFLHKTSMLVAPNLEGFSSIRKTFKSQVFLHPDVFATYLKLEKVAKPTKEEFIKFAKANMVGSIYFVIDKKVYIVDATTFSVISSIRIPYKFDKKFVSPFYTRIKDIQGGLFSFDDKIKSYDNYYKNLLRL